MFERLADNDFAYLTTTGRRTGKEHTIEIWFALHEGRIYMLSGGGDRADWIRNLRKTPRIRLRIGTRTVTGAARVVRGGTKEDERARELLDGKYQGWRAGRRLSSWARNALPIAIELP